MALRKIVIMFAMFGYVTGYRSLYAFHLVAAFWVCYSALLAVNGAKIAVIHPRVLAPLFAFFVYAVFTVLWVPSVTVWGRYIFYLLCGCLTVLAIYQSANSRDQLIAVFKIIAAVWLLNMVVGILESLGLFRLPMSPYSPYVGHFGHIGMDWSLLSEKAIAIVKRQPTGFNWNRNNFGFVLILGLPFLLWIKNKAIAAMGLFVALWLLVAIGSRGSFVAIVVMVLLIPFYYRVGLKQIAVIACAVLLLCVLALILPLLQIDSPGLARMATAFDQISRGLNLISGSEIVASDSTGERASIYLFGLKELFHSYGLGVGFGGIESLLIQAKFAITSFHFFFLQLLIDFGVVQFLIVLFGYVKLGLILRSIGHQSSDKVIRYLAESTSLSLFIAIPASISPSGVHYVLPYYALVGLALAIIKVDSLIKISDKDALDFAVV